jgi:hypothetical protein
LFLLVKDTAFVDEGKPSGINYLERFIIWSALAAKLSTFPAGRTTIERWEEVVFRGVKHKQLDKPEEVTDGLKELVTQLDECAQHDKDLESLATHKEQDNNVKPSVPEGDPIIASPDAWSDRGQLQNTVA